jgi:flagellar basal-body rod protein FlgC
MDYLRTFAIASAGMAVERLRVDVAASNLANADTVVGAGGGGYRPMHVVATPAAVPGPSFSEQVEVGLQDPAGTALALPQALVEPSLAEPRTVHQPGHPLADEHGMVTYPAVDSAAEMMTLMAAVLAYEANVAALNTARALALKALEIGGGQ